MKTLMSVFERVPRAAPDGLVAAVLLSFLATAGLFYVNIMPALIEGLMTGLSFSARQAGLVGSANVYGAAAGALLAAFLVRRLPWRPVVTALLPVLMAIDLASMGIGSAAVMIAVRAVHGFVGGALVGFGFAVMARTLRPERTFGVLLIVQFSLGGLGVMFLPHLAATHGTWVLFVTLFAFAAVTLLMTPWLAAYPPRTITATPGAEDALRRHASPFALVLLAVFLFQASNMLLFSFIIDLARDFSLELEFASGAVGAATWVGMAGSLLVILISVRFGRMLPLLSALVITALGIWLLHFSGNKILFALANCATGVTWAFVMPYLLGMCSEFDARGQAAAFAGFASKLGLASGPLAGALLLGESNYDLLIDVSTAGILACMAAAIIPARLLDRGFADPAGEAMVTSEVKPLAK
ncbi:MAG: MFS transporter [Steroidobacter sp.]